MSFSDPLGGLDLQALIDTFPHYVMLIDEDHRILMTNHAVLRQLGKVSEEVVGRSCPQVVHGRAEFGACPLREALATGDDAVACIRDDESGHCVSTGVYPTGYTTDEGKRIFLHVTHPVDDVAYERETRRTSS